MNDKEIMENLLLNLKGECDLFMHGAIESFSTAVHSAFTQALNDTLTMQNQVYSKMSEKVSLLPFIIASSFLSLSPKFFSEVPRGTSMPS